MQKKQTFSASYIFKRAIITLQNGKKLTEMIHASITKDLHVFKAFFVNLGNKELPISLTEQMSTKLCLQEQASQEHHISSC